MWTHFANKTWLNRILKQWKVNPKPTFLLLWIFFSKISTTFNYWSKFKTLQTQFCVQIFPWIEFPGHCSPSLKLVSKFLIPKCYFDIRDKFLFLTPVPFLRLTSTLLAFWLKKISCKHRDIKLVRPKRAISSLKLDARCWAD